MVDELWIGPATRDDYYAIGLMHASAYVNCYGKFIEPKLLAGADATSFIQIYFELTMTQGLTIWVAKLAGTPVAVAIFGPEPLGVNPSSGNFDAASDGRRGWIEALYVDHSKVRDHIGQRLLERISEQMDFAVIALDCAKLNKDGCAFWEKMGFRRYGDGLAHPVADYGDVETVRYVLERFDGKKSPLRQENSPSET
ncbi:GNAT family N-acetyltransferase [Mycobacterium sp. Z3061]|uniref:GNAT family N-acetyltransferase n=1 Tax=Mycobacterium sp. Z3061 TaxID=3073562 RepID=UPI00287370E2|nr:GNAT family N-acetyltransferase [Mycobacterium sp. Z3061]